MSVTIKDVAKAAGVSVATVSRVLNNSAAVSPEATAQVNSAIKELCYSPNFLGRNLRKCETNVILGIVPSVEQSYYSPVIRGMEDMAAKFGYDILITTSNSNIDKEMRLLNMVFNRTVDAAVMLGTHIEADVLNSLGDIHNIALCCERVDGVKLLTVTVDNVRWSCEAVKKLISMGHRRIGMVSTITPAPSSTDREIGYKMALAEAGIKVCDELIFRGDYDYKDGCNAFSRLISLENPPTAFFCISDLTAVGVIREAIKEGFTVGKGGDRDVSVLGFDNISISEMFLPEISTVSQPCYQMGQVVIQRLIQNIAEHRRFDDTILLDCEVLFRHSTAEI